MSAYYNEIDRGAAAWLRELIKAGAIAPGEVDERDIRDVCPGDLTGYTQCHFFAGIGVWSYALRRAGWPDDEPVWTGSCPCQPFSAAGKGNGFDDERHLWPAYFHLIEERRPARVFGEQVASKDGLAWLDLVQTDLEGTDYAFWAGDTCAAGFGAPHIRQRLHFVAESGSERCQGQRLRVLPGRPLQAGTEAWRSGEAGGLAHAYNAEWRAAMAGRNDSDRREAGRVESYGQPGEHRQVGELANLAQQRCRESGPHAGRLIEGDRSQRLAPGSVPSGHVGGYWADAEWIACRDGKYRPIEPGTFPLAHGAPARVGRLRGYGNAIVADQAEEIIMAYMDTKLTSAEKRGAE